MSFSFAKNAAAFLGMRSPSVILHSPVLTGVVSTLYVQNRLNTSKIKAFRVYEPLPPISLAWATQILRRKPSQGRAESPLNSALMGFP